MKRMFYEREENPPQDDSGWISAAKACREQREKIRFFKNELEDTEGFLDEMLFLPPELKTQVRQVYNDLLEQAQAEYERRRNVLLEMGYDDGV